MLRKHKQAADHEGLRERRRRRKRKRTEEVIEPLAVSLIDPLSLTERYAILWKLILYADKILTMMNCQLETCCCCVNLRTGALIIGYLNLIGSFFIFAWSLVVFIFGVIYLNGEYYLYWQQIVEICFIGANMILGLISVLFTFGLLYGLHKHLANFVRPFLIYNAFYLGFHIIDFAFSFAYGPTAGTIIIDVLGILLTIYFLLVIRSYWIQLKANGPPLQTGIVYLPEMEHRTPGYPPPSYPAPEYTETEGSPAPGFPQGGVYPAQLPTEPPPYRES